MHRNLTRVIIPLDQGLSSSYAYPCTRRVFTPQRSQQVPQHPLALLENTMRDMDRQFDQLGREFNSVWRELAPAYYELELDNRAKRVGGQQQSTQAQSEIQIQNQGQSQQRKSEDSEEGAGQVQARPEEEKKYRLNLYMGDNFSPENIKVSLKDRVMTVEAKTEQKSQDGNSRVYQEVSRQFTLPPNVDLKEVKSVLTPDGILRVEAPLPPEPEQALPEPPKPTAIPIEIVE